MEALNFLKEAKRKCSSTTCEECHDESYAVLCPISEYPDEKLEKLVSEIEQWSKEHPIITNARKFEEVFGWPQADIDSLRYARAWWDEPYEEPGGRNEG